MIYSPDTLCLSCQWIGRSIMGGEFVAKAREFIQRIQNSFAALHMLKVVMDPSLSDGVVLPDYSNFETLVVGGLSQNSTFMNPEGGQTSFTPTCLSAAGFRVAFMLSDIESNSVMDCALYVRLSIGASGAKDAVAIYIARQYESEEFVRRLMETCLDYWEPDAAFVSRGAIDDKLNQPLGSKYVGWLTYLSDVHWVSGKTGLPPDVTVEVRHSGVLIQVGHIPIASDDNDAVDKLRHTVSTLEELGYL